ncbi:MAG: hypothetical protein ACRD96_24045, partial [Bryobacteraceae bacterium]
FAQAHLDRLHPRKLLHGPAHGVGARHSIHPVDGHVDLDSRPPDCSTSTGRDEVRPWSVLRMVTTCWPGSPSRPAAVVTHTRSWSA